MFAVGRPLEGVHLYIGRRDVAERQMRDGDVMIDTPGIVMDATISEDGASIIPPAEAPDAE